jgi:hypothetical protein
MPKFRSLSFIVIFALSLSCGKDVPTLEGVDAMVWKDDKFGCEGKRFQMLTRLRQEKDKLLALDEIQITKVLGKADRNELFKRNQKFFYYFLQPAPECKLGNEAPLKLVVRFNAMGLAKEVVIE